MKEIISYGRFQCKELTPHKNRGMEITYIEKGMLEWEVEGVAEKVPQGSVFFTLPWQAHGSVLPKEPNNVLWHLLFHLEEDDLKPCDSFRFPACFGFSDSEMKTLSTVFSTTTKHGFPATPTLRWLMPTLINELQSSHELGDTQTISLLRAVLVELKRMISGEIVDNVTPSWSEKKARHLLTHLSTHCDQPWTLQQMADHCGIQRTQLTTLFKKLTGETPIESLSRLRIERAKTLLRETDTKIIDIAFHCGFSSSQYFANTFKHATHRTPSEYRIDRKKSDPLDPQEPIPFRSEQEERQRIQRFSAD